MSDTWLIDIDGTLLYDHGTEEANLQAEPRALPGAVEFVKKLRADGHQVIFITGRAESARVKTTLQLEKAGLLDEDHADFLICGLSRGHRFLVNDTKPSSDVPRGSTAHAMTVIRNEGLEKLL